MSIVPASPLRPDVTGAVLALGALNLAIFVGLFVGICIDVLLRGLAAMLASYAVGWGAGLAASRVIIMSPVHGPAAASQSRAVVAAA